MDAIKNLSQVLNPITEEEEATAAVALILTPVNRDVSVLFVKRVERPQDPWSGQVALPGGKRDPADKTLKETVVRETAEETGINILNCGFLGVLKTHISLPRPGMKILPFVILCDDEPLITLNTEELEEFFWISLTELAAKKGRISFPFGEFPAYIIGDHTIWGLTYKIIEDFFQALADTYRVE
ncbi:MAG: CoA pyrophosphatase [Theionarchaea archaeon]|nr:CoA pyrophosphatase [Theionarchaea archaeon]